MVEVEPMTAAKEPAPRRVDLEERQPPVRLQHACGLRERDGTHQDPENVACAFKEILPLATALVAHHFQRLLINRALKRLKKKGDRDALRVAVQVSARTRLGLRW